MSGKEREVWDTESAEKGRLRVSEVVAGVREGAAASTLALLRYTPMYTVWTEALLETEPGKQERALLRTTGDTPKRLRDCKTLLVGDAPLGLGSGYEDLCVN
jgi:hypothetical protein